MTASTQLEPQKSTQFSLSARADETVSVSRRGRDPRRAAALLQALCSAYLSANLFKVGDLVTWKDGLKNRRRPEYGQPMVVVRILEDEQILHDPGDETGSPYFREKLDIVCGVLDDQEDMDLYYFDSNRLQPFPID